MAPIDSGLTLGRWRNRSGLPGTAFCPGAQERNPPHVPLGRSQCRWQASCWFSGSTSPWSVMVRYSVSPGVNDAGAVTEYHSKSRAIPLSAAGGVAAMAPAVMSAGRRQQRRRRMVRFMAAKRGIGFTGRRGTPDSMTILLRRNERAQAHAMRRRRRWSGGAGYGTVGKTVYEERYVVPLFAR